MNFAVNEEKLEFNSVNNVSGLVDDFKAKFKENWWKSSNSMPELGKIYDRYTKNTNEKELDLFIKKTVSKMKLFSRAKEEEEANQIKAELGVMAKEAGKKIFGLKNSYLNLVSAQGFSTTTYDFVMAAKKFDSKVNIESILQAVRNVWIMNGIQLFMGVKIEFSHAIFAYSMLYPYTDNYLDDPKISIDLKNKINQRFKERITGRVLSPINLHETKLFELVGLIEKQYARRNYIQVFESLLAIQSAQERSLIQQSGSTSPYEMDIMDISFEKGGASVLADAYLVNGTLAKEEAEFMFGFGVLLQLADDLQDVALDFKNKHMTIFSQIAGKWPLDELTNKLFNFINIVLESDLRFTTSSMVEFKNVIRYNCEFLILQAIARNRSFFTKEYVLEAEKYSLFNFNYLKGIFAKLQKEYVKFNKRNKEHLVDDVMISLLKY